MTPEPQKVAPKVIVSGVGNALHFNWWGPLKTPVWTYSDWLAWYKNVVLDNPPQSLTAGEITDVSQSTDRQLHRGEDK